MIEKRSFGRTGHESSRVIFGSAGLGGVSQERADEVVPLLLAHGVNHLDTAASYGDAELRLAPWLASHKGRFFIATKTGERTADGARRSLEQSLARLGVDRVDLIQLHNLVEEEQWAGVHGAGGALEALLAARDEGLVSHVGVTGHGLRIAAMHLRSLERYDYDSVLFPVNHALLENDDYRRAVYRLLELCAERNVATQAIKSIARRRWRDGAGPAGDLDERLSWYEPLVEPEAIGHAVDYVLSNDQLFLITSSDFRRLPAILEAAEAGSHLVEEAALAGDAARLGVRPLFDGGALERI